MGKVASKTHRVDEINNICEELEKPKAKQRKVKDLLNSSFLAKKKKRKESFSKKKIDELFEYYKKIKEDESLEEEAIGPNGVSQLLKDLGLEPDDIISFVIGWRLGCQELGWIYKEEFIEGMKKLKIDSIEKLKEYIPVFKQDLDGHKEEVWNWTFVASQETRKTLELEVVYVLIGLFFPEDVPHSKEFVEFLKEQESTKVITKDQWSTFYEFVNNVNEDLSNFDADDAWPCLFDEYVEWRLRRNSVPEGAGEDTKSRISYGIDNKPNLHWGSENIDYKNWY